MAKSFLISWVAPTFTGISPITGYDVGYTPSGGSETVVSTGSADAAYTLTGLTDDVEYSVRVRAENAEGKGKWSDAVVQVASTVSPPAALTNVAITVEEDYAAPSQVTGLAVDSTGDGTIDLSWSAPASEAAITDYRVEYTPSGGSAAEVLVGSAATSYQLTGLTNDTEYSVRVAAISAGGQGDYSAVVTGTPSAALPVLEVTVQFNSGSSIADSLVRFPSVSGNATTIRVTAESGNASGSDTFGLSEALKVLALNMPGYGSTASWRSSDGFIRFETSNRPASYSAYFTFESLDANGVVLESVSNVLVRWKDVYDDG